MLFTVVIFGVIATFGFRKKLMDKGYEESRAWAFPLMSASLIFCFAWFIIFISRFWIKDPESNLHRIYPIIVEVLAMLVFGLLVSRLWKQIKNLPDGGE